MSNKKRSLLVKVVIALIAVIIVVAAAKFGGVNSNKNDNSFELPTVGENDGYSDNTSADEELYTLSDEVGTDESSDIGTEPEYLYDDNYEVEVTADSEYEFYLTFYNEKRLNEHYEKHGKEMGFSSPEEYEEAANKVVANSSALHKTEKEDGDDVYYLESTNEFVIVSGDGYIRTYFLPDDGLAYFNRQ